MSDWTLVAGQADDERLEVLTGFGDWPSYDPSRKTYRLTVRSRSTGMLVVTVLEGVVAAPVETPAG